MDAAQQQQQNGASVGPAAVSVEAAAAAPHIGGCLPIELMNNEVEMCSLGLIN